MEIDVAKNRFGAFKPIVAFKHGVLKELRKNQSYANRAVSWKTDTLVTVIQRRVF